jgi:hypothetical protein
MDGFPADRLKSSPSVAMPTFAVMMHGVNFLIRMSDAPSAELMGFYINPFVEADTDEEAEALAVELVRTSPKLRPTVANSPDDPPRIFTEEIVELSDWPDAASRPLSGFVFYSDAEGEWRNEYKLT